MARLYRQPGEPVIIFLWRLFKERGTAIPCMWHAIRPTPAPCKPPACRHAAASQGSKRSSATGPTLQWGWLGGVSGVGRGDGAFHFCNSSRGHTIRRPSHNDLESNWSLKGRGSPGTEVIKTPIPVEVHKQGAHEPTFGGAPQF